MDLQTYLDRESLSPSQFADRMGKSASTITRVLNGTRKPGLDLLIEIMEASGGAVTPNDFVPDPSVTPQSDQAGGQ